MTDQMKKSLTVAAIAMSEQKTPCNSTKYYVLLNGVKLAPKRVWSLAYFLVHGVVLPVSRFSGGVALNNKLKKAGLRVLQFSEPGDIEPLYKNIPPSIPKGESTWQSYATS